MNPSSFLPGAPARQADGSWLARVPGGELRCRMTREEIALPDAVGFAARNNARRRFLFVSRLLGRHLPTAPAGLTDAARRLAEKLRAAAPAEPCLFVGLAETATTLGQAVFREWQRLGGGPALYVDSTRRRTGGEIAFEFSEVHSHATGHAIHLPTRAADPEGRFAAARSLIIVDDESTTARTAAALQRAYTAWRRRHGSHGPLPTHLAVLLRWHPATSGEEADDAPCCHSLLEGHFDFTPDPQPLPEALPPSAALDGQTRARVGARGGLVVPESLPAILQRDGEPLPGSILVVGTGEYGFAALLLAESLVARGLEAFVQATTRSPVLPGGAIGHVRRFPALSGEGHYEYLYNVPDDHPYGRVILLCEDRLPPPDHPILALPNLECRLAPNPARTDV